MGLLEVKKIDYLIIKKVIQLFKVIQHVVFNLLVRNLCNIIFDATIHFIKQFN